MLLCIDNGKQVMKFTRMPKSLYVYKPPKSFIDKVQAKKGYIPGMLKSTAKSTKQTSSTLVTVTNNLGVSTMK